MISIIDKSKIDTKEMARTILVQRRTMVLTEAYRDQFDEIIAYCLKLQIAEAMASDEEMSLDTSRLERELRAEFSLPGALTALAGESSENFYADHSEFFTFWQKFRSEYLVVLQGDDLQRGEDLMDRIRNHKVPTENIVEALVVPIEKQGAAKVAKEDELIYGAIRGSFPNAENFVSYLLGCQRDFLDITQLRFEAESGPKATDLYLTARECFESMSNPDLCRFFFPEGERIYGVEMGSIVERVAGDMFS